MTKNGNNNCIQHERYKLIAGLKEYYFFISSASLDMDLQFIKSHQIQNIGLSSQGLYLSDGLEALKELSIKKLIINPSSKVKFNYDGLKYFTLLEYLKINNLKADKIDLTFNTALKKVYIENCSKLTGVNFLEKLESLILTKPSSKIMEPETFRRLDRLNHLTIANTKLPNGVGFLANSKLNSLFLYNVKELNLAQINELKLEKLQIEKCKDVTDSFAISSATSLKELKIIDSFSLLTAKAFEGFPYLETLVVMGKSHFEDGDLSALHYQLKHFSFDNKKHYSSKYEEFKLKYLK